MKAVVLILVAVLVYGGTVVVLQGRLYTTEVRLAEVTAERDLALAERDAALVETSRWRTAEHFARQGNSALLEQAQSCLDREAQVRAEADEWRILLEAATLRDMTQIEEQGVPDNATREALGDMLDKPL